MSLSYPTVHFVILHWNQPKLTSACLDSLLRINYPNFKILLVDNGSTDDSIEQLETAYSSVEILRIPQNVGYSMGNNKGVEHVMSQGAEYVLLLNNDTEVAPDFLTPLIETLEGNPAVGVTTPKILYYDHPDTIWSAGAHIDWEKGRTYRLQAEELDNPQEDKTPRVINFASGCAICIKREVLDKEGLFDPRFFIYFDETDWCTRVIRAGYQCLYVPESKIWHKVSATTGAGSPSTTYLYTRNEILFINKSYEGWKKSWMVFKCWLKGLRTVLAYTLLRKNKHLSHNRDAILLGLRDAFFNRYGRISEEVRGKISSS